MKKAMFLLGCAALFAAGQAGAGSMWQDRAGIGLRGSYWSPGSHEVYVRTGSCGLDENRVDAGGGGWISFLSGVGERGAVEFSWGGLGRVKTAETGLFRDDVEVEAVMPVTVGYQWSLFPDRNTSAFQPYLSAGGGPYIVSHIRVIDEAFSKEEVTVRNRLMAGMYAGGGGYFSVSRWFAFQGELKYHLVNLDPDRPSSGFELGFGAVFTWKR